MKQTLFITGTDTGVGKTVLTALLARFLRECGINVAALKPVCSGGRGDARVLRAATAGVLSLDEINPWYFRAPIAPWLAARREGRRVRIADVLAHIRAMQNRYEVLLVEGAGGLLSPLGGNFDSRDLITALDAKPVVVAPNQLGVVNHVLLTLEALPQRVGRQTSIVLMSPSKPDASTKANVDLIAEFSGNGKIFTLPRLGGKFSVAPVLRDTCVRRTLGALV
jgi:dethiobiotin synthetase